MIVRKLGEVKVVECPKGGFYSNRFLLESDGMGFSMTKTIIPAGRIENWHYKNHMEACFCIKGIGSVRVVGSDDVHRVEPGVMYALNENDNHIFVAFTEVELICVFNPALKGDEVHQEDGSYVSRSL
jgi:L-ectoine synthase